VKRTTQSAAIEALPFEAPKLSTTAVLTGDGFAERLERALARSGRARLIEHRAEEEQWRAPMNAVKVRMETSGSR